MDRNDEYIQICPNCVHIVENLSESSSHWDKVNMFYRGFLLRESECPFCHEKRLIDSKMTFDELKIIGDITDFDRQALLKMLELKQENFEQYQSDFKTFKDEHKKIETSEQLRKKLEDQQKKLEKRIRKFKETGIGEVDVESEKIKFCPNCNKIKTNSIILEKFLKSEEAEFHRGFLYWFETNNDSDECPCCHEKGVADSILTRKEFRIIESVSHSNRQFLESMIALKEKDPIEYQLKYSQFEFQVEQKKVLEKQEADLKKQQEELQKQKEDENKPKCPHCKSTNIKPISALNRTTSILVWGIFSKKINKSFQCNNCKYTW